MDVTATAIYMTYSYIPNAPSNLHTTPAAAGGTTDACGTGVDNGFIGGASSITSASTGGVTFYATPSTNTPAARVAAYFTVFDHTTNSNALTTYTGVGLGSSGVQQSVGLNMTAGHTYTWHAVTGDDSAGYSTGQLWSGSSASCTFTYDPAPPTLVTVTSKDFPANGGGKTVGSGGTLTLSATDTVSGIDLAHGVENIPAPLLHIVFRANGYGGDLLLLADDVLQRCAELGRQTPMGHKDHSYHRTHRFICHLRTRPAPPQRVRASARASHQHLVRERPATEAAFYRDRRLLTAFGLVRVLPHLRRHFVRCDEVGK